MPSFVSPNKRPRALPARPPRAAGSKRGSGEGGVLIAPSAREPGGELERDADAAAEKAQRARPGAADRARQMHRAAFARDAVRDVPERTERGPRELGTVRRERDQRSELENMARSPSKRRGGEAVAGAIQDARGKGTPLPESVRSSMEQRFGENFAEVRVHTGSDSSELTRALGARAFTTGEDIFFRAGGFQPGTAAGDRLLSHELAHVSQQASAQSAEAPVVQLQEEAPAAAEAKPSASGAEKIPDFGVGLLATDAFTVFRKSKNAWAAQVSGRLGRQLPIEQLRVLGTVAVARRLLRQVDRTGEIVGPPSIEQLLKIVQGGLAKRELEQVAGQDAEGLEEARAAEVLVPDEVLARIEAALGPSFTEVIDDSGETAERDPMKEKSQRVPPNFMQGFVMGAKLAHKGDPAKAPPIDPLVLAQIYVGYKAGVPSGVVKGLVQTVEALKAVFTAEFWNSLKQFFGDTLPELLGDAELQHDAGFALGVAFLGDVKELSGLPPLKQGHKLGELVGQMLLEIGLTIVAGVLTKGAGAALLGALKALRGLSVLKGLKSVGRLFVKLEQRIRRRLAKIKDRVHGSHRKPELLESEKARTQSTEKKQLAPPDAVDEAAETGASGPTKAPVPEMPEAPGKTAPAETPDAPAAESPSKTPASEPKPKHETEAKPKEVEQRPVDLRPGPGAAEFGRQMARGMKERGFRGNPFREFARILNERPERLPPHDAAEAIRTGTLEISRGTMGTMPPVMSGDILIVPSRAPIPNAPIMGIKPDGKVLMGKVEKLELEKIGTGADIEFRSRLIGEVQWEQ